MAPSFPRDPIHVVTAAAMLRPLVGNNNAYNWLADMRRSDLGFARNNRISSFPKVYRDGNQMYYSKHEDPSDDG
jgi:hypothetical protein